MKLHRNSPVLKKIGIIDAEVHIALLFLCRSRKIFMVQENNTCASIITGLSREVNLGAFLSWNININSLCSNIASLVGSYICIR